MITSQSAPGMAKLSMRTSSMLAGKMGLAKQTWRSAALICSPAWIEAKDRGLRQPCLCHAGDGVGVADIRCACGSRRKVRASDANGFAGWLRKDR